LNVEVAWNDQNWVSYDAATWEDHNAKGFMILARSIILWDNGKKLQIRVFFNVTYKPGKKSYVPDVWFCQVTWPRGTSSQSNGSIAPIDTKRGG
jgi:hypothetical protein